MTAGVALAVRALVLVWASARFPPAADGLYYHTIAARIALGLGSTWQWPDGAITYAAHYPVGYPAIVAIAYALAGPSHVAAGAVNALLGSMAAVAVRRLVLQTMPSTSALAAGLAIAIHPGLVMYTPALMTEGVTAALLAVAVWAASRRSRRGLLLTGVVMGIATLVRP